MTPSKRKAIEQGILEFVKEVTPGGGNHRIYSALFKRLSDEHFIVLWEQIKKRCYIPVFLDNFDQKEMVDYAHLKTLSEKWKIPLEQQVTFIDPDTGIKHTTPQTAIVGIVEVAKQRQIVIKKMGVAKHDFDVEDLTGQPVGDSKGAGVSNPENNIFVALGLTTMAKELASVKGGDLGAYRQYKSDLVSSGTASVQGSLKAGSGVKSMQTAEWLMKGRHLIVNLRNKK